LKFIQPLNPNSIPRPTGKQAVKMSLCPNLSARSSPTTYLQTGSPSAGHCSGASRAEPQTFLEHPLRVRPRQLLAPASGFPRSYILGVRLDGCLDRLQATKLHLHLAFRAGLLSLCGFLRASRRLADEMAAWPPRTPTRSNQISGIRPPLAPPTQIPPSLGVHRDRAEPGRGDPETNRGVEGGLDPGPDLGAAYGWANVVGQPTSSPTTGSPNNIRQPPVNQFLIRGAKGPDPEATRPAELSVDWIRGLIWELCTAGRTASASRRVRPSSLDVLGGTPSPPLEQTSWHVEGSNLDFTSPA
jgi:hypothetical protein